MPDPYPLVAPSGVAVDEADGDVYVANDAVIDTQTIILTAATGGTFTLTFENPVTRERLTTAPIVHEERAGHAQHDARAVEEALVNAG